LSAIPPAFVCGDTAATASPTNTPVVVPPTSVSTSTNTPVVLPTGVPTSVPTTSPASGANAATFVAQDNGTQGSWKGVYGNQGYWLEADGRNLPTYAQVSINAQPFTWTTSTADPRALQKAASPTDRLAATWFDSTRLTADV